MAINAPITSNTKMLPPIMMPMMAPRLRLLLSMHLQGVDTCQAAARILTDCHCGFAKLQSTLHLIQSI